jgi:hypothetical protein
MELSSLASVTPPMDDATETAQAAILARDVNFAAMFTAGLLGDRDVQLLRRYDKKDRFTQAALFEKARLRLGGSATLCAAKFGSG